TIARRNRPTQTTEPSPQGSELKLTIGFDRPLSSPGNTPASVRTLSRVLHGRQRVARCASLALGAHNLRNMFRCVCTSFVNPDSEPWLWGFFRSLTADSGYDGERIGLVGSSF